MPFAPLTPALPGFDIAPGPEGPPACRRAADGEPLWQPDDVKRAVAAVAAAGVTAYSLELAPDGTVTIVVPGPSGT